MSWNYRVVEYDELDEVHQYCAIHEVYYDKKGKIKMFTKNVIEACGNDKDDLINVLLDMLSDVRRHPILKMSELKKICKCK